jgi:predicted nucleic acid-binding Zn ribbon protein
MLNSDDPSVTLFPEQRCCCVCGKPLCREGAQYCSHSCRMIVADFEEFCALRFILLISRWAGAPSQEEALRDYLRQRMWEAVRRLPNSADILSEVLVEIAEIIVEEEEE